MVKVLISDPIADEGVKMLMEAGLTVDLRTDISAEELKKVIGGYDAIVVRSRTKLTAEVLEKATSLKAIARAGVGLDNIDTGYAKEKGVEVFNSPEAPCNAVAELVIGLILCMARHITVADSTMKQGKWEKNRLKGIELAGKKVGIIGLGRIGAATARRVKAFDADVVYWSRTRKPDAEVEIGIRWMEFKELLKVSDIVSLHLPGSPETHHIIGEKEIGLMKDGVYVVNAARGGIIDEAALKAALDSGKVAGAALDVFESEPSPDPELVRRANVVCTPHIGAGSVEAQLGNSTIVAEKLIRFFG
ncbi:MAG TPA: D-2-hydroxyacid dehydrogenase [Candidatus Krumholzibacteriaceae bacterium]|nr:D-2-hydroxyacid dehydrogenase [Candidatus Krumholzibacteriaceae bacterium]